METAALIIVLLSALCVPAWIVLRVRESARRRDELQAAQKPSPREPHEGE
ncbi:MAG: hypothetical protein VB021_02755 [Oscillospiraceae bacterium]|nr:hypothetical protein [Oscillospiraceae bacterium]